MTKWYQKHLELETNPYGATFEGYEAEDSKTKILDMLSTPMDTVFRNDKVR